MTEPPYLLTPIGYVRSSLHDRATAPRQGYEGGPSAWVELGSEWRDGLLGIAEGDDVVVITWLDRSRRDVLQVHPRRRMDAPLCGVFATRSPDRPNPIGLHRVTIVAVDGTRLCVEPMDAIDGTPVIDIKPVLARADDR